jgi:hypothetical protein
MEVIGVVGQKLRALARRGFVPTLLEIDFGKKTTSEKHSSVSPQNRLVLAGRLT